MGEFLDARPATALDPIDPVGTHDDSSRSKHRCRASGEKAGIGVFLTLTEPTKPMITEAASAGQHEEPGFAPVPRLRIVTIEQAMTLRERSLHLPARHNDTFKRAAREEDSRRQGALDL